MEVGARERAVLVGGVEGVPDGALVGVDAGRVDVAVAEGDGGDEGGVDEVVLEAECAEADGGDWRWR